MSYLDTISDLDPEWQRVILNCGFADVATELNQKTGVVYPPKNKMWRAFEHTSPSSIKVVILGQDPYHNPGEANGMCFSVPSNFKVPPSLKNVFKELERVYSVQRTDPNLIDWAQQGVLMINAALTVEKNSPASHSKLWEQFTLKLIQHLNINTSGVVYMLWGNFARSYAQYINQEQNLVLQHTHPSPLSRAPFTGCNHFVLANEYLVKNAKSEIKWV
jgi:uracil-DNA glycosylase